MLGFLMLTFAVMMQMFSTLAVYMRDIGGFPNKYYGYIISLNAVMVVSMQFWVSRKTEKWPSMIAMAIGAAFSTLGYFLFGFAKGILFFAVSMAILTVGEMILAPISQSIAAKFSPPDLRGRYMAVNRFAMSLSNIVTPSLAGLVIDNYDPRWIWYVCGIVGSIAVAGYYYLHVKARNRLDTTEQPATSAQAEAL
jgi:MFS family permease